MNTQLGYGKLGTIISGTMRAEYLIPAFSGELRRLAGNDAAALALCNRADRLEDYESEEAETILDELSTELNNYALPYCYFGARRDDLADYGFWVYTDDLVDMVIDDGGRVVSDLFEDMAGHCGHVLLINERGDYSLFYLENGELTEIWSIA